MILYLNYNPFLLIYLQKYKIIYKNGYLFTRFYRKLFTNGFDYNFWIQSYLFTGFRHKLFTNGFDYNFWILSHLINSP